MSRYTATQENLQVTKIGQVDSDTHPEWIQICKDYSNHIFFKGPQDQRSAEQSDHSIKPLWQTKLFHNRTRRLKFSKIWRISYALIVRHPFRAGPEDQDQLTFEALLQVRTRGPGSNFLILLKTVTHLWQDQRTRAHMFWLWGTTSGQDQRTRNKLFNFSERQSLIYDRTRGPGLICFDYEALLKNEWLSFKKVKIRLLVLWSCHKWVTVFQKI